MGKRAAFIGYRLLSRLAEILPARSIRPLSRFVASVAVVVLPAKRRLVERNLRRITNDVVDRSLVRRSFQSYIRYWFESFRLPVVPVEHLDHMFAGEAITQVFDARANGHGVVFALPHLGNWEIAGAWLVRQGIPLTVVVERIEPDELFVWFKNFRTSLGLTVLSNGPRVGAELLAALRRGEAIALLSDRDVDGTGGDYEFFGEVTKLPKGPATLALRSGAKLLPVAIYEEGDGYRAVVDEPIPDDRSGSGRLADDVDRMTQELARRFEVMIRRAPEQWHLFQPNWPSDR